MLRLSPARERATLLVLAAVQFTHVMDFMIMMPLGPQLMRAFGIGTDAFSHVVAAYGLSAGVFGALATLVLDRFDRKRSLLVLYAGFTVATLACALARDYSMLLVARVLAGACGGVAGSVVNATIGDVVPQERRGAGMALVMSAFSLAQILGVPAGLALAARWDWHAPFFALAAVGVVVVVVAAVALPRVTGHIAQNVGTSALGRLRDIARERNHWRAFGLVAMLTMSGMVVVPFLATSVVRNGGVAESAVSMVYLCGGIATLVGNNALGRLGDRFGHARLFYWVAGLSVLPVLAVGAIGRWPLPVILVATTLFIMSMGGRWTPAMALVTMSVEGRLRGGFLSLSSAIQALFGALAALLAGAIVREETGGRIEHFLTVTVVSLAFLAAGVVLIRRLRIVDERAVPRSPAAESGATD